MVKAVKVGNIGTAHGSYPATPVISGSPTVKIDGIPAARVGDPLQVHSSPSGSSHPRKISQGSSCVFLMVKKRLSLEEQYRVVELP